MINLLNIGHDSDSSSHEHHAPGFIMDRILSLIPRSIDAMERGVDAEEANVRQRQGMMELYPRYSGHVVSKEVMPVLSEPVNEVPLATGEISLKAKQDFDPHFWTHLAEEQALERAFQSPAAILPQEHPESEEQTRLREARRLVEESSPQEAGNAAVTEIPV